MQLSSKRKTLSKTLSKTQWVKCSECAYYIMHSDKTWFCTHEARMHLRMTPRTPGLVWCERFKQRLAKWGTGATKIEI